MSNEPNAELLDAETRLIFTEARTGQILYQAPPETKFTPIPSSGDRITLTASRATMQEDSRWELEVNDQVSLLVDDVEYSYNYVGFENPDDDEKGQRLVTDVYIYAEQLAEIEEEDED